MVKNGDMITINGSKAIVIDISLIKNDNRYIITYKEGNQIKSFREGDEDFKVI